MHFFDHLHTINKHRRIVRHYCFKLGLYWQGLTHDLSKYSPTEFWRGVKYYMGYRSPNDAERLQTGMSKAWLHHKGRNKHHFEYWVDYNIAEPNPAFPLTGMKMPKKYVAEMFCDRLAACKVYQKDKYTDASPYDFFQKSKGFNRTMIMHESSAMLLDRWLLSLKENGEKFAIQEIRNELKLKEY